MKGLKLAEKGNIELINLSLVPTQTAFFTTFVYGCPFYPMYSAQPLFLRPPRHLKLPTSPGEKHGGRSI